MATFFTDSPCGQHARGLSLGLGLLLLAAALIYLGVKVVAPGDTIDFKYIHLAGALWQEGQDPYSAAYAEQGQLRFAGMNRPQFLLYPPQWWGIARASALLSYETAGLAWRIGIAACLLAGCLALHRSVTRIAGAPQPWRSWLVLVFAASMSATAITLSLGQTSGLLFLGVCLYVQAFVAGHRALMGLAIVLVMLKPNFGLAMCVFLLPSLFWWPSLFAAAAAVLAMSLPALLPFGAETVIRGYLHALGQWEGLPPNTPESTTGLRHIAGWAGITLPGSGLALGATALAGLLGAIAARTAALSATPRGRARAAALLIALLLLLIPLHTYDMMLLLPLIALAAAMPARAQAGLLLALLACYRPNTLEQALRPSDTYFAGTGIVTLAILAILLLALAAARARPADGGTARP